MPVPIENGPVVPHAQRFADEVYDRFRTTCKTYNGHQPTRNRALDCWDTDVDLDALAEFARQNAKRFGILYVIWKQRIWNPSIDGPPTANNWRRMAARTGGGDPNHMRHVHVSFVAEGPSNPEPAPEKEDEMFKPAPRPSFHIVGRQSKLLLGCVGWPAPRHGALLEQFPADGGLDQRWHLWGHADGTVSLVTDDRKGGLFAVDIPDGIAKAGAGLRLWSVNWSDAQRFRLEDKEYGTVLFRHKSGLAIDVPGFAVGPSPLQLWDAHGDVNQQFVLVRTI